MVAELEATPLKRLAIPDAAELETRLVLKKCVAAQTAIAELRVAGHMFANPAVGTGPLILLEAKDSCQIANVVTAIDPLFSAASGIKAKDGGAAQQVLRYRATLLSAAASAKSEPPSVTTALCLARALAADTARAALGEARLAEQLADWARLQSDDAEMDPLVRLAVSQYQLASLQPFALATGPVARILSLLSLMRSGLLDLPALNLSRHLLDTKADYDRTLAGVMASGDWPPFLDYVLTAVEQSARWSSGKLRATRAMIDMAGRHIRRHAPKIYSQELVELIFAEPYTCISHIVDAGIAKRQTASVYLKQLDRIGILRERRVGRNKVFIHRKYMYLLTRDDNAVTPYPDPAVIAAAPSAPAPSTES